jgi:methylenetetrahydrofolate dehydrogenase (NADP+)/methenyltetrahydrofolate cyclohydrolase
MLIDGKKIAAEIEARLAKEIRTRKVRPHLAVVLVGDDPASRVYVGKKEEAAGRIGIGFTFYELPHPSQQEVLDLTDRLNADRSVNGIIVQLPLPKGLDEDLIIGRISPEKDVDGLTGRAPFISATAGAVLEVLRRQKVEIAGARAVVVGAGRVAGLPISSALERAGAEVETCDIRTKDLPSFTKEADILVSAVGKPGLIRPAMVKAGAAVIDVGISRVEGKLKGDVDPAVEKKARFLTPVPGGIGPLTVVKLLENVLLSWKFQDTR